MTPTSIGCCGSAVGAIWWSADVAGELADALGRVVDALIQAGVHATTDPRDLAAMPCAWVTVHDVTAGTLCGGLVVRADVALIAGNRGTPVAVDELSDLLDKALTVLALDEPARGAVVTPPGQGPMPALVITTTTD